MFIEPRCRAGYKSLIAGQTYRCQLPANHTCKHKAIIIRLDFRTTYEWDYGSEPDIKTAGPLDHLEKIKAPLYSWRWWTLERGLLSSITANHVWRGPVMTTKRNEQGQLAIVSSNNPISSGFAMHEHRVTDYGVYSYKTPALLAEYNPHEINRDPMVLGKIENLGHVVEHQYGYRSQRVIIRELWAFMGNLKANSGPWINMLKKRYQCDVNIVTKSRIEGWIKFYSGE